MATVSFFISPTLTLDPGTLYLQQYHTRGNPREQLEEEFAKLSTPGAQHSGNRRQRSVTAVSSMPAPAGTKRVRGVQIHRPFIYGSEATPFDPASRPKNAPTDHTHSWKVFVRGVDGADISYWLKKVQFKLHDTYPNSLRMIEGPPFEVEETGWGEFEIAIKFYFTPESTEKPQTVWHGLKLHPYGDDVEGQKERRETVKSVCYEEVMFNEPVEQFYELLTGGMLGVKGKGAKAGKAVSRAPPTAEIPERISKDNVFSREEESKELDRLGEAVKTVQKLIGEEKSKLIVEEGRLQELEKTEGKPSIKKR